MSPALCPGGRRAAPWAGPGRRAPFSPSGPSAWLRPRDAGARIHGPALLSPEGTAAIPPTLRPP